MPELNRPDKFGSDQPTDQPPNSGIERRHRQMAAVQLASKEPERRQGGDPEHHAEACDLEAAD